MTSELIYPYDQVQATLFLDPEKKKEAEASAPTANGAPPVDRGSKPVTVSDAVGNGGMGYRVRDINDLPSMVRREVFHLQLTFLGATCT